MSNLNVIDRLIGSVEFCPWGSSSGRVVHSQSRAEYAAPKPLYNPEQRRRRDASRWTLVQGVLAPLQFVIFLVSLALVLRYLGTGGGESAASASVVVKTIALYTIMITGAIWEHDVFGRYLFAPAFYWEDMVSMLVLALHTVYVFGLATHTIDVHVLMWLALAAYASYVVNATQFVLKLRAARKGQPAWSASRMGEAV